MNSNKTILQNKSSEVIHQKRFFKNDLEMMEMEKKHSYRSFVIYLTDFCHRKFEKHV